MTLVVWASEELHAQLNRIIQGQDSDYIFRKKPIANTTILSKSEFKKKLVAAHPDNGGDPEEFRRLLAEGKRKGYINRGK